MRRRSWPGSSLRAPGKSPCADPVRARLSSTGCTRRGPVSHRLQVGVAGEEALGADAGETDDELGVAVGRLDAQHRPDAERRVAHAHADIDAAGAGLIFV